MISEGSAVARAVGALLILLRFFIEELLDFPRRPPEPLRLLFESGESEKTSAVETAEVDANARNRVDESEVLTFDAGHEARIVPPDYR